MPIRKKTRRPIQTRGWTKFNRSDLPVVIRVSDEDQALIPHIEVSRAIGFLKAKARQLTHLIWRSNEREGSTLNSLPYRTYYYAMPGSDIKILELKTNPREQSWHARIIGGAVRFGQFIWVPADDVATFQKQNILVKSAGFEGPYEVFVEPDLVAGNIDWKGPTRTTDINGDPLIDPTQITDVVTWQGPENRVMQYVREAAKSSNTWKDGAVYAKAPIDDRVVGAAIQGTFGSGTPPDTGRKDVMICEETATFSKTGGVQGIGVLNFNVYIRPEGATIGGILDDDTPRHPVDNPNGWKLIATLGTFDDIAVERWTRTHTFYFNRNGTEASAMLPSNLPFDLGPLDPTVPIVRRNISPTAGEEPNRMPMHLRLATITIDAFAETASISFGAREGIFQRSSVGSITRDASGSIMNMCIGAPIGTFNISRSETGTVSYTGSARRVAVDYVGNTRVFARLDLIAGAGTALFNSATETHVGNNPAFGLGTGFCPGDEGCANIFNIQISGTFTSSAKFGYTLNVGSSAINLWHEEEVLDSNTAVQGICNGAISSGSTTSTEVEATADQVGILWLDLREALVIYAESSHTVQGKFGTANNAGSTTDDLFRTFHNQAGGGLASETRALIHAQQGGNTLIEYREGTSVPTGSFGFISMGRTRAQGETTDTDDDCIVGQDPENCTINWSNTVASVAVFDSDAPKALGSGFGLVPQVTEIIPVSLESFNDRDDNLQSGGFAQINWNRRGTAATDTAGNTAFSFNTFEGLELGTFTYPGPKELTFIHGDDLVDVMNQVEYFDPGPDEELGTEDDILQPPVDEDTGRARVIGWFSSPPFSGTGTIKIL